MQGQEDSTGRRLVQAEALMIMPLESGLLEWNFAVS